MFIIRLSVKGYKRILLSDIRELSVEFNSPYQIILGTNGSGKSSLLKEISPLPGNPSDYEKGGRKYIELRHHNRHYKLLSEYEGGKNHHSFIRDDVELNDGATITVQRELVRQEFGLTDDLHEFLMGKHRLTTMGPAKRRELITQMSDNDLTYAFGLFKRLSSQVRDHQGTLKHIKSRLARETEALRSMDVQDDLEKMVNQLQDELTTLMQERRTDLPNPPQLDHKLDMLLERTEKLSNDLLNHPIPNVDVETYGSSENVLERQQTVQSDIQTKHKLLSHYSDEHHKIQKLVGELSNEGSSDPEELANRESTLKQRIDEASKRIDRFTFDGDVADLEANAQTLKSQLVDVLSTMPSNDDRRYSRKSLEEAEETIQKQQGRWEEANSRLRRTEQDIKHIEEAKRTQCPQCGYTWKEGVSENHLEQLTEKAAKFRTIIKETEETLKKTREFREEIMAYSTQYGRLRSLAHAYPKAHNFFDWLMEDDRVCWQPSQHIPMVDRWIDDLHRHSELWTLNRELDIVQQAVKKTKAMEASGAGQIGDNLNALETKIQILDQELRDLDREFTKINTLRELIDKRAEWIETLQSTVILAEETQDELVMSHRYEAMGELIRSHQSQLAGLTKRLNDKKQIENIINDLESSLKEVQDTHRITKLLATALSPTDGIIAKQMGAFIECLVQQMNDVISQIYTYPLKIFPCGVESGELDYKFPMSAGDDQVHVPDVGKGSDGQQEIIDFAFRLVAILYLGFNDYPLYLDEMGRHQDETHLGNVMNYVKMLLDANRHSQLFMISHFAVGHGGFSNAEVLVLNDSNISIPLKHNDHAEIS